MKRRTFLKAALAGTLAAALGVEPRQVAGEVRPGPNHDIAKLIRDYSEAALRDFLKLLAEQHQAAPPFHIWP